MRKALAVAAALSLAGCAYIPWHPFGTPLSAERKAEQRVERARDVAGDALVEEVHKTKFAVDAAVAGAPHALEAAQAHARVAVTLANQVHGAPTVADEAKWQDLIARQTALDEKVRKLADAEAARRTQQIAKLSVDLDDKSRALEAANARAQAYAQEKAAIADRFLKLCWAVGAVIGLFVLGRLLACVAQFYPAVGPASQILNGALAKVLHAAHRR